MLLRFEECHLKQLTDVVQIYLTQQIFHHEEPMQTDYYLIKCGGTVLVLYSQLMISDLLWKISLLALKQLRLSQ